MLTNNLEQDLRNVLSSDMERLQMELDFVDVTMNRKKPLLEMKGDHNIMTENNSVINEVKTIDDLLDNPFDIKEPLTSKGNANGKSEVGTAVKLVDRLTPEEREKAIQLARANSCWKL